MDSFNELLINLVGQEITIEGFAIVLFCGFLIGMAKTGIAGAGHAVVPLMVLVFGGKPSTGFLLPILIMADIFAVKYYNRHAQWKYIIKLLPWAIAGILIGVRIGNKISEESFNQILSILVIIGVLLMVWQDVKRNKLEVPNYWWFALLMGLFAGFASMIGNAAGSIIILYLLAIKLPKNAFVGTAAWFFFIINLFKVPFHIFAWNTISMKSFTFDLLILPAIGLGAFVGIKVVKILPERLFKILIISLTLITAIFILKATF